MNLDPNSLQFSQNFDQILLCMKYYLVGEFLCDSRKIVKLRNRYPKLLKLVKKTLDIETSEGLSKSF